MNAAIASASAGDPVTLVLEKDRWHLKDAHGDSLGRMARSFAFPEKTRFARAEIAAILERRKEDSDEAFHHTLHQDTWEVVVPEIIFEVMSSKPSRKQ